MYAQKNNTSVLSVLLPIPFRLSRNSIKTLVQMLPSQKPCGWSHQTEVLLVTAYWLACEALCKATADILAMPRATVGKPVKEMMTILQREVSQARGDGGQALLALLAVGHSGPQSGATSGFSLGRNNIRNAMWTLVATAGCLWCQRSIFGCLQRQTRPAQVPFLKKRALIHQMAFFLKEPEEIHACSILFQSWPYCQPVGGRNSLSKQLPRETWSILHRSLCI